MLKKWLKKVFLFPFSIIMAVPVEGTEEELTAEALRAVAGEDKQPINPRNAIFNEIADKSDKDRFGEESTGAAEEDTEEDNIDDGIKPDHGEETLEEEEIRLAKQKQDATPAKPEEQMVDIIVDGEKRTVPLSQIVDAGKRTFQKEQTADKRLEEATLIRETAEREVAERKKVQTATEVSDLAKAIQYGTEEEAAGALQKVMELGRQQATPQIDQNAITAQVMHQMRINEAIEKTALPPEEGGFADIIADPDLNDLYVRKVLALGATPEGMQKTPWQLCQEVGKSVREKFLKPAIPVVKDDLADKRAQKKTIINLPSASAKVPAKAEEKEESPTEYIERMALQRQGAKR